MRAMAPPGPALPQVSEPQVETVSAPCPMWHVILLDDDDHSYDYVIEMLMRVFDHSLETAYHMALEVDTTGRVIVDTTTKERAELKQEQVHGYGPDWRIPRCAGAMTAVIEPVE
jgi:ATP-dependent Clp protease adaptor protein ClpS